MPIHALLQAAQTSPADTWASRVSQVRSLLGGIPNILDVFGGQITDDVRSSGVARRKFAHAFRKQYVLPALRDYDIAALQAASTAHSWPYTLFQEPFVPFDDSLLTADWGRPEWQQYRTWAVTRSTGRIPLVLFGIQELPSSLPSCPWCASPTADIKHLLFLCPETRSERELLLFSRTNWHKFREQLFAGPHTLDSCGMPASRVRFVFTTIKELALELMSGNSL